MLRYSNAKKCKILSRLINSEKISNIITKPKYTTRK